MTRRVALACSFALTVVVSFAVVTLGSSAGWFGGETEASTAVVPSSQGPQPGLSPTPEVIFVDIPVVSVASQQSGLAPQLVPSSRSVYHDEDDDDRHGDDDRHDDDDDDDSGHGGRGRDHAEDD